MVGGRHTGCRSPRYNGVDLLRLSLVGFTVIPCSTAGFSVFAYMAQRSPTRSSAEIQGGLRAFAARWRDYSGSERGEAQTFLNELIGCYGADRNAVGWALLHRAIGSPELVPHARLEAALQASDARLS